MEIALSRRAKQAGQNTVIGFSIFNASGFGLSGGPMVCLLALTYGAGDIQMGFLYAGLHLMNFTSLLVPTLFGDRDTTSILRGGIWFRSIITALYPILLLLPSDNIKVWWIMGIYFLFLLGRGFSMSAFQPVYKAISSPRDISKFIGRLYSMYNLGILLASALCFAVMQYLVPISDWLSEERAFTALLFLGFILNLCGCFRLSKLPSTGYLTEGSIASVWRAFHQVCSDHSLRGVTVVAMTQAAQAISAAYMMSYLKNIIQMSSAQIFLLTVVGYLSSIAISQIIKVVGLRIPSRTLLFSSHVLLAGMGLIWACADRLEISSVPWFALLYGLSMLGLTASTSVVFKLKTSALPKEGTMQVNIVMQVATTLAALMAIGSNKVLPGIFAAAGVASGHAYMPSFVFWSFLSLLIVVLSIFLLQRQQDDPDSLVGEISMLSPSNLFNIFRAYRSDDNVKSIHRQHTMEGVMMQPTHSSRAILAEWMTSADLRQRLSALRTLNNTHASELFDMVLSEAMAPESPLRSEAITTLGLMGNTAAIDGLETCLEGTSSKVRSAAVKSLLRLGKHIDDDEILLHLKACTDNRQRLEILLGLISASRRELAYRILSLELEKRPGPTWSATLFAYIAEIDNRRETMLEIFNEERKLTGSGLEYLLAEMEPPLPEGLSADELHLLCSNEEYEQLASRLQQEFPADWLQIYDRTTALGSMHLWYLDLRRDTAGLENP